MDGIALQLGGRAVVFDRFVDGSAHPQQVGKIGMGIAELRIDAQRVFEARERLLVA